ncbi:MAG: hypothetical protein JXA73_10245 [Acidobacteria bacterium]|nr:hypothetical protein [Acidobacteriota bacterium]
MKRNRQIPLALYFVIGLCLIVFWLSGFAADPQKNRSAQNVTITASPPSQPYLSTGFPQVVVVNGTDREMGIQYGEQTAAAIVHNVAIFKSRLYDSIGSETTDKDMQVWDYYLTKHDPVYKEWLLGIMDGCRRKGYDVSYLDLIMLMVYPTELWSRPKAPYPSETGIVPPRAASSAAPKAGPHSCNTFAATGPMTPDGKPIHGITSMAETEMMDNIILLAFPRHGAGFVSQTYAGRVSSNFAMNSKGFAWTMTAIMSDAPVWGVAPEVYFHYLAQLTASPAEALEYLKSTPKAGVTGGFIFTDASGSISVFEGTADHFRLSRPGDRGEPGPFVVQTNHLVHPSLHALNPKWLSSLGTYARHDTVSRFLKDTSAGAVNFAFGKNLFASCDWYDAGKSLWNRNRPGVEEISNSHTSVGQAIFHAADQIAYLQAGTPSGRGLPAYATGEYVKIKLATDPKTVVKQADIDALAMYWDACDSFEHDMNAIAGYLTTAVAGDIECKLDQAMAAYSQGMDRASFAGISADAKKRTGLWAEAMTYYAKAQLYAQMAKTALVRARDISER